MTLGGLALAVGILVDDATVTIENIERHSQAGEELEPAIMVGAGEIALPALVSSLCICIVFIPMFFLPGSLASFSYRLPRQLCSRSWLPTSYLGPSFRRW
jgi:Cation/multidrug efflux pump